MNGPRSWLRWVAVTALFTDRTIVRVVGHQPLHHAFAELFGFRVVDRNKGTFGGWRHTGHHQATTRVFRVLILLHRTLAASTDAPQRRMPAKIRNIKAEGQTSFQQVVRAIDLVFFAVYMNRSHLRASKNKKPLDYQRVLSRFG